MPTRGTATAASRSQKKPLRAARMGPKRKNNHHNRLGIKGTQGLAKKLIHDRPVSSILMAAGAGLIVESLNGIKRLLSDGNQKTRDLTRRLLGRD